MRVLSVNYLEYNTHVILSFVYRCQIKIKQLAYNLTYHVKIIGTGLGIFYASIF